MADLLSGDIIVFVCPAALAFSRLPVQKTPLVLEFALLQGFFCALSIYIVIVIKDEERAELGTLLFAIAQSHLSEP